MDDCAAQDTTRSKNTPGTLFLVVGPSGAGKDTLIDGARKQLADNCAYVFATRVITRPQSSGGENHTGVEPGEFKISKANGEFILAWEAHGLFYGILAKYSEDLNAGRNVIVNISRSVVSEALSLHSPIVVIEITAPAKLLAQRLASRARESVSDIETRLRRKSSALSPDIIKKTIINDGLPEEGINEFLSAITRKPPETIAFQTRKLAGDSLNVDEYSAVFNDMVAGNYTDKDISNFLTAITESLSDNETLSLARARAESARHIEWPPGLIVDKHSMGGIPGNRITLVVVPIVASYGLIIPKTSSRAITSPAGTADTMEVLANVNLGVDDVQRVVAEANGCIAWNGRLNHSRIDTIMNSITRPLNLNSLRWSVASILSKKLAAGTTHCVIDIPLGQTAKVRTSDEARELKELFQHVGKALQIEVKVRITDGNAPIGRGIGPALEARDVLATLENIRAPSDLRKKALEFASSILAFDPNLSNAEAKIRAAQILDSGAAYETFQRMLRAQGAPPQKIEIGTFNATVAAPKSGTIKIIDSLSLAEVAREAGCPKDKGAGLDLQAKIGDRVEAGDALYHIHARDESARDRAQNKAKSDSAFRILES